VRSAAGTRVIIDAGTGIRRLGKDLMREEFERGGGSAHLLISHTHWDHIQGLPFFSPLYQKGNHLYVYARGRDDVHLRAVFASQTYDPYFPISLEEAKAGISFR
jgi:phosphoribosyl 1,2-cyclic phosphodiesterase